MPFLFEFQLQNLDQTLCSKSEQKFSFMTIPQFPNLQQSVADVDAEDHVGNSLLQIWELTFGPKAKLLFRL